MYKPVEDDFLRNKSCSAFDTSIHPDSGEKRGMRCPNCSNRFNHVVDSRIIKGGLFVRRRRYCTNCCEGFTTYEFVCSHKKFSSIIPKGAKQKSYGYPIPDIWYDIFKKVNDCAERIYKLLNYDSRGDV